MNKNQEKSKNLKKFVQLVFEQHTAFEHRDKFHPPPTPNRVKCKEKQVKTKNIFTLRLFFFNNVTY